MMNPCIRQSFTLHALSCIGWRPTNQSLHPDPFPRVLIPSRPHDDARESCLANTQKDLPGRSPILSKTPVAQTTTQTSPTLEHPEDELFTNLLSESLGEESNFEGKVVTGKVIDIDKDTVVVDIGLKSEGRIPQKEFTAEDDSVQVQVGDSVEVYIERIEDRHGMLSLSRERARRQEAWVKLEKAFKAEEPVLGKIFNKVKGGFTVKLSGTVAFLPGSHVDIRPVKDITPLMNVQQPFQILKMDQSRNNIVVSRRAVLEEARAEARTELIGKLEEGMVMDGIVKNLTSYGAFVDLGGIDGLLHVTDISWRRVNHPSDALQIGQAVRVQIIKFNQETQRISLGMKQLDSDPWSQVKEKYVQGERFTGRVMNITDYGAFVELEAGIEGLVHISEMSWTRKNMPAASIVSKSQEVEVMVLEVDASRRRISLGLKQCMENPWEKLAQTHPKGEVVTGVVKNITDFGLFVNLGSEIDGMVHMSDLAWGDKPEEVLAGYKVDDEITVKVLDIDIERERVSLGVKQLTESPASQTSGLKKGTVVTALITKVGESELEVSMQEGTISGFIKRSGLARERSEQQLSRFAVGEKVDAQVLKVEKSGRVQLSIKAREIEEEKQAIAEYGSTDSGASLGDILGAALRADDDPTKGDKKDDKKDDKKAVGKDTKPQSKQTTKQDVSKDELAQETEDKAGKQDSKKAEKEEKVEKAEPKKETPKKAVTKKQDDKAQKTDSPAKTTKAPSSDGDVPKKVVPKKAVTKKTKEESDV